jgi:2,5-diketo-D-gluconate reductase A
MAAHDEGSLCLPCLEWAARVTKDLHGDERTDDLRVGGRVGEKYGVSEAQVLLRWAVQKGYPVLPKRTNPDRLRQNAGIFGFNVDDEDMAAIEAMDRGDGVAWAMGDPTKAP